MARSRNWVELPAEPRRMRFWLAVCGASACTSCWDPALPGSSAEIEHAVSARFIAVEPAAEHGVSPISRFTFELAEGAARSRLRLYRGELSDYHLRRIVSEDVPGTLLEREVEIISWGNGEPDGGAIAMANGGMSVSAQASAPLEVQQVYTWALIGQGALLAFQVSGENSLGLQRLWPRPEAGFWGYAAYCATAELEIGDQELVLEPGSEHVALQRGLGLGETAGCWHFELEQADLPALLIPPLKVGDQFLDPAPLVTHATQPVLPASCDTSWQPLGPGCVAIADDRFTVQPPHSDSLWLLSISHFTSHQLVVEGAPFTVKGLVADREHTLDFVAFLADGQRYRGHALLTTQPLQPHVVINEVLSNPLGSEPAQEWIELYNDGSNDVNLAGWAVTDGTGDSGLPAYSLTRGEYLIITSESFMAGGPDVAIADGVSVLRLPTLGSNGLSNSGEELRLISASGQLASRFPARAASTAGVSIARIAPDAPDDAPQSFVPHAAPGASPGAKNAL